MQDTIHDTHHQLRTQDPSLKEADKITLRNQKESPLLRLPPEIRNAIYTYVLGSHRICFSHESGAKGWTLPVHKATKIQSVGTLRSITSTCRQTHAESALMFFKLNQFGRGREVSTPMLQQSLNDLGKSCREGIAHWYIDTLYVTSLDEILDPLDRLPGLQTVTIVPEFILWDEDIAGDQDRIRKLVTEIAGKESIEVILVSPTYGRPESEDDDMEVGDFYDYYDVAAAGGYEEDSNNDEEEEYSDVDEEEEDSGSDEAEEY